jgi:hypothetical protein
MKLIMEKCKDLEDINANLVEHGLVNIKINKAHLSLASISPCTSRASGAPHALYAASDEEMVDVSGASGSRRRDLLVIPPGPPKKMKLCWRRNSL